MWEIIGYVALGILALLVLLLIVPVYARISFQGELRVCVRVWGIPIFRYKPAVKQPKSTSTKRAKKKKADKSSPLGTLSANLKRDGVVATLAYLKELTNLAVGGVRRLLATLTVDKLCLHLYVTGDDAAQTAETTGKVCAVLYPTITAIQQTVLRIRKRAVTVTPDFLAEKGRVVADVTVHVIPIRILIVAAWLLCRYGNIINRKEVSKYGKQSAELDGTVD